MTLDTHEDPSSFAEAANCIKMDMPRARSRESRSHSETKGKYLRVERGGLWEGYRDSRRCSRDTYPESYITEYTSIRR